MNNEENSNHEQFLKVLDRYAEGLATESDVQQINDWYASFNDADNQFKNASAAEKAIIKSKIFSKVNQQIFQEISTTAVKRYSTKPLVSILLVVTTLLITVIIFQYNSSKTILSQTVSSKKAAQPGGNRAVLTLANGERISLDDASFGVIANETGVKVSKTIDGELIYTIDDGAEELGSENDLHTIETPVGGQYQIILPDGSKVWLNSSSSLKYTANFNKQSLRKVLLTGEGYFEVARNVKKPFIVDTKSTSNNRIEQTIEVLGTSFNVNAYGDDYPIKTTLLEGAVLVNSNNANSVTLDANQQAINTGSSLAKIRVNSEYAVAWKDGYFRFNDKTLAIALKEVARWYNVNIIYKNPNIKNETLAGTISKYSNIKQVLEKMELTGALKFEINDNNITVR
jgi:transmembrane sensor